MVNTWWNPSSSVNANKEKRKKSCGSTEVIGDEKLSVVEIKTTYMLGLC